MKIRATLLIISFIILVGCNRQKSLEEILVNKPNEAWICFSNEYGFTHYIFHENKIADEYILDAKTNKYKKYKGPADNPVLPFEWSVTNDSILNWKGHCFDVLTYDENTIFLYFQSKKNTDNDGIIVLEREKGNIHKRLFGVIRKRQEFPEKYK